MIQKRALRVTDVLTFVSYTIDPYANTLASGNCSLSDGSVAGDWRLPTKDELLIISSAIVVNPNSFNSSAFGFVGIKTTVYWASDDVSYGVDVQDGIIARMANSTGYIWPVRSGL